MMVFMIGQLECAGLVAIVATILPCGTDDDDDDDDDGDGDGDGDGGGGGGGWWWRQQDFPHQNLGVALCT